MFGGSLAQNCADLRGRFKQFCCFVLDNLDVLLFGNIRIADVHQLHNFAFGDDVGRIGHHFQNTHAARTDHQLEGACIEEVADQNGRRVAEEIVCGFTAAAQFAFVNDIVVQKGGGVDEFHHRRQRIQLFIVMPDCFACQNGNNRTQSLTARADDVCADLRNQRDIGLNSLVDDRVHFGKVIGQVALEVRQVFEHKTFSVDKTERRLQ